MSEQTKTKKKITWKNPLALWGASGGNYEVPTITHKDPSEIWEKTKSFKVPKQKLEDFIMNINHQIMDLNCGIELGGGQLEGQSFGPRGCTIGKV
tara:strand:- start:179 stop:463 length:285 start_codon:yes stop_codon:yes gene_type:complete